MLELVAMISYGRALIVTITNDLRGECVMRYYTITYPSNAPVGYSIPVFEVLSEDEIYDTYFVYQALKYLTHPSLGYIPSKEEVLDYFIVAHWTCGLICGRGL